MTFSSEKKVLASERPMELEGPNFRLIPERGADKLVVFLTAALAEGAPCNKFDYWEVGNSLPVHRLFVTNGERNEWYQRGIPNLGEDIDGTVRAIKAWAAALGVKETLFVGTSMGAYGALLFAALSGSRALAFGPETTLRRPCSRSLAMMPADTPRAYPDLKPLIHAATAPVTIFSAERDPVDLVSLDHVADLPMCVARPVRAVTHGVAGNLKLSGQLMPILEAFIADRPLPALRLDSRALSHNNFASRYFNLYVAHEREQWERAVQIGTVLTRNNNFSHEAHNMTGWALFNLRRYGDALRSFAMANTIADRQEHRLRIGMCYRMTKDYETALTMHTRTLTAFKRSGAVLADMSLIYETFGLYDKAHRLMEEASTLTPDSKAFAERTQKLANMRGTAPKDQSAYAKWFRQAF